jgi:hypothetical protein
MTIIASSPSRSARRQDNDDGQAFALVVLMVVLVVAVTLAVAEASIRVVDRARAQAAADAAALTAVEGGYESASRVAGLNGASLLRLSRVGEDVVVVVAVGDEVATARSGLGGSAKSATNSALPFNTLHGRGVEQRRGWPERACCRALGSADGARRTTGGR